MKKFLAALSFGLLLLSCSALASTPAEFLKELVEISSGTRQIDAVNRVQERIAERLKKLGFEVQFMPNPLGENRSGKLLLATRIPKSAKDPRFVTLVMHADTVFEPESGFTRWNPKDAGVVNGPGVIDDKGGVVIALTGLEKYLGENPGTPLSFRVVSSPCEETGSIGFTDLYLKLAKDSRIALGFEPSADDASPISDRKGNYWIDIHVTGREAHAGKSHPVGINACLELARKLDEISKLTDYSRNVTASVGHFEGGKDKFNIVCGTAEGKVDTRFPNVQEENRLKAKIDHILKTSEVRSAADGKPTEISYEVANDCPPMTSSVQSRAVLSRYAEIISKIEGKPIGVSKEGGSSDLGYFSVGGAVTVDGLGAVGQKMHTAEEWISLPSLDTRSQALAQYLKSLAQDARR